MTAREQPTMRFGIVATLVLLAGSARADQVESELGFGLSGGVNAGNVRTGTLWLRSPIKLRADWAAFIEEDRSRRYRIGLEVPLAERIALGIRPGIDFPMTLAGQHFVFGLGLRSYLTPYTLHGAEAQLTWQREILKGLTVDAGLSTTAFFFGNDLPNTGAIVEFQGLAGLRLPL